MKKSLIIPILAAVAVVVLAAVGCNRTNQTEENNVLVIESSMDTSSWQTYTNTKYGYSIRYPTEVTLSQELEGPETAPAVTADTNNLQFRQNGETIVSLRTQESNTPLTSDYILNSYPEGSRSQFVIQEVKLGELNGYRLDLGDVNANNYHFYFQGPNNIIIRFAIEKNNETSMGIMSTFRFQ
jgi:hypothetical protein